MYRNVPFISQIGKGAQTELVPIPCFNFKLYFKVEKIKIYLN